MVTIRFRGEILILGANPYVLVSGERARRVKAGQRKPIPVVVRVNDKPAEPWRINLMPVGDGSFYLYLHETVRKASGSTVGDIVAIEMSFDATYKGGPQAMPKWFLSALTNNHQANSNWEKLSSSRQKEVARYLNNLKSTDAQARNLDRAMRVLSGEGGRFMGRSWRDGS